MFGRLAGYEDVNDAERHIVTEFSDKGISGAKGRDQRPGLDTLLQAVARRKVDMVLAWSVDRLGRSLQDLLSFLGELHAKGVDLYLHQQGLDTGTPAGKALFQMMGVFAEFERAIIRERVRSGLERAKAQGKVLGRRRNDDPKRDWPPCSACARRASASVRSLLPSASGRATFSALLQRRNRGDQELSASERSRWLAGLLALALIAPSPEHLTNRKVPSPRGGLVSGHGEPRLVALRESGRFSERGRQLRRPYLTFSPKTVPVAGFT